MAKEGKKKILKIKSTLFAKFAKVMSGNEFDMNCMFLFWPGRYNFLRARWLFRTWLVFYLFSSPKKNGFFIMNKEINTCG